MRNYSDEAIILGRRNFGEADRILIIYTKNHGKLSVIAKGIRRPKSKKRGHLEIFSQIKFQAAHGKGIDLITEAENIQNFPEIRKNLAKASLAYYFMEVIGKTSHDGESHREIFDLILEFLGKLENGKSLKTLRFEFIRRLLITLGFWPEEKFMKNPDMALEDVMERSLSSLRVGKKVLQ